MSVTYKVQRQGGDYVRATIGPTNRKSQTRFGLVDAMIVAFFLLAASGLFFLLGRS